MAQEGRRDFVKYTFYKVAPAWRMLTEERRERSKAQFAEVLEEFAPRVEVSSYSLVGTRATRTCCSGR